MSEKPTPAEIESLARELYEIDADPEHYYFVQPCPDGDGWKQALDMAEFFLEHKLDNC